MNDPKTTPHAETPTFTPKPGGADPFATRLVGELVHDLGIIACRFDPTNELLFAGARDTLLHRWDLSAERAIDPPADPKKKPRLPPVPKAPADAHTTFEAHESWIAGLDLFGAGERIATGDYVGGLTLWSDRAGVPKPLVSFEAHDGSIRKLDVSPDDSLVATAGNDGVVRVWRAGSERKLHLELTGHDCHVYNVLFHPDGKSLVSADLKGRLKHWDAATGKLLRELDASALHVYSEKYEVDVGGIRGMAFDARGTRLACTGAVGEKGIAHSGNPRVLLFDWEAGELVRELKPEKEEICTAWGVRFHPDGFLVASGGSRTAGLLWFWTEDTEIAFHNVRFRQRAPGFDLDLAPDGRSLAVANHDGTVRLYDLSPEPNPETPGEKAG